MTTYKYIVGVSCYYHDSSITIIKNEEILFALQEERITRIKNDQSFPKESLKEAIRYLNISLNDISAFVFYEKPLLKFERLMEGYLGTIPFGFKSFKMALPDWTGKKLFLKRDIVKNLQSIEYGKYDEKIFFSEHHLSHLASSFYPSPFEESLLISLDGVGEISTSSIALGKKNEIEIKEELEYPHSLGLLYSAFTYFLGFKVNEGEYKMMGLAPYGEPVYKDLILKNLLDLKDDGSFQLNLKYFNFITGLTMTNKKFNDLFNMKPRNKNEKINQNHMNIASSIQNVTELIISKICRYAAKKYNQTNLCLSGGVALNCVANGKLYKEKIFNNIWIQPASGDAGGSLGAALAFFYFDQKNQRRNVSSFENCGPFLGPDFNLEESRAMLESMSANYEYFDEEKIIDKTTDEIIDGKIIGWFQGRTEFGPRALGNRSILADPRNKQMQKILNLKTKFREGFRPFAPAILESEVNNWFEFDSESPYMLMVGQVKSDKLIHDNDINVSHKSLTSINNLRSKIPAVTHVDNSARIQTVNKNTNKLFYKLINNFYKKTGVPLIINTSFNVNDEPIVNSPIDAYKCFLTSNIDILIVNNFFLRRDLQYKKDTIKFTELDEKVS